MKGFFCKVYSIGKPKYFFIGGTLFAATLFVFGEQADAIIFTAALLLTFSLVGLLKIVYRTPRPKNPMIPTYGSAFPSGHAAGAAFLALIFYHLSLQTFNEVVALFIGILFGMFAIIVAISRVFLRAHTTFQAIVGLSIGLVIPLIILLNQGLFI